MSILDSIITATTNGPGIVSENHDKSSINIDTTGPWDASEYGMTREEAIATGRLNRQTLVDAANRRANLGTTNSRINLAMAFTPAWHGLGVVLDGTMDTATALRHASLADWGLRKVEMEVRVNDKWTKTGAYAIVRSDTGEVLTKGKAVGERYTILTNEECFDFMDSVIQGGCKYEVAGAIDDGRVVWLLARHPDMIQHAPADESASYIMFGTSHDGSSAIWCYPTNVRAVCANTYRQSMGGKRAGISFRHTKNMRQKAKQAADALGLAHRANQQYAAISESLVEQKMNRPIDYFQVCIDSIVDVTIAGEQVTKSSMQPGSDLLRAIVNLDQAEKEAAYKTLERTKRQRADILSDILDRYESDRNNGLPSIAGSAWAAVNAVTEFADHSSLNRFRGGNEKRKESRFFSVLDGPATEIKEMAIQTALAMQN